MKTSKFERKDKRSYSTKPNNLNQLQTLSNTIMKSKLNSDKTDSTQNKYRHANISAKKDKEDKLLLLSDKNKKSNLSLKKGFAINSNFRKNHISKSFNKTFIVKKPDPRILGINVSNKEINPIQNNLAKTNDCRTKSLVNIKSDRKSLSKMCKNLINKKNKRVNFKENFLEIIDISIRKNTVKDNIDDIDNEDVDKQNSDVIYLSTNKNKKILEKANSDEKNSKKRKKKSVSCYCIIF